MSKKTYLKPIVLGGGFAPPDGGNPLLDDEPGEGEVTGSTSGLGDQDTPAP
jgi:hypothetical protein